METSDIPTKKVSNWEPMTNQYLLGILGKLGEESSELSVKLFRAIIQGIDECDPDTGKVNRKAIQDEIADVIALSHFAMDALHLSMVEIDDRILRKQAFKQPWFDYLKAKS